MVPLLLAWTLAGEARSDPSHSSGEAGRNPQRPISSANDPSTPSFKPPPGERDVTSGVRLRAEAELGFLAALSHTVQFSNDGSRIDYVDEGGQDVLFPFSRLSTRLRLFARHDVTLLYQPLSLVTQEVAARDLIVDGEIFEAGTPMRFTYGFPFWRAGYTYLVHQDPCWELGLGGSLQIRNATIVFESLDGRQLRSNRDVGPVPLLRAYARRSWRAVYVEGEVDGFYAPVKYINGGESDVVGAIVDVSARVGMPLSYFESEAFLNVRYLGGGAEGTSQDDDGPGDGFTRNWLHFLTLSLGARANLL
jgi:hypothetical protein